MEEARIKLVKYGRKLVDTDLTKGTGGNLSVYDRKNETMAISPSGIDFYEITAEDIVVMKLDGSIIEGTRKPSSEWVMHKIFYEKRNDLDALIHAHTTYSTVLATLRWELPASHYMIAVAGSNIRVAEYATYGSPELAENAYSAMIDRKAVLLANHGIITGEKDLLNAFNVLEEIEYCSKIYVKGKAIGNPVILEEDEMTRMAEKFKTYGQKTKN